MGDRDQLSSEVQSFLNLWLIEAIESNQDPVVVAAILHKGARCSKDKYERTAVMHAAKKGNETLGLLLSYNIFCLEKIVNAQDKDGNTALHHAAKNGKLSSAKILLKKGADRNVKNNQGMTPFDFVKESGPKELERILG